MNVELIRSYLTGKSFCTVSQPFEPGVDVYKVKGKMFATLAPGKAGGAAVENQHWWLNLKCEPHEALMLRELFDAIMPGYHMNKQHWNTVVLDGTVPQGEIERMIDNSYTLVVDKLPKKIRQVMLDTECTE